MRGLVHAALQCVLGQILLARVAVQQRRRAAETRRRRRLNAQLLGAGGQVQVAKQRVVFDGEHPRQHRPHHCGRQNRGARHRQAIGFGAVAQPHVVHRRVAARGGHHFNQKTRRLGGFGKKAMHMRAEEVRQPKGNAARRATYAAGQIDQQRVRGVNHHTQLGQLCLQVHSGGAVARKQRERTLVVDKVAMRIARGLLAARGHGFGVIARVLHHRHPALAQALFFPVLGVGRHVNSRLKTQRRGHHTDAQAQVARGADRDLVLAEQNAGRRAGQHGVVVSARLQQPVLQRQGFGQLQHLMDAAARLDGPGHRQAVVGLDQQAPEVGRQAQRRLQRGHGQQSRLDDAPGGLKFRKKGLHDGPK